MRFFSVCRPRNNSRSAFSCCFTSGAGRPRTRPELPSTCRKPGAGRGWDWEEVWEEMAERWERPMGERADWPDLPRLDGELGLRTVRVETPPKVCCR